jgi:hypothetical protein
MKVFSATEDSYKICALHHLVALKLIQTRHELIIRASSTRDDV